MSTAPPPASPDPRRRPSVVVLRAGDPGDPVLHVVHTLDGHVGALRPLASAVGSGVAVRGLASPLVARPPERFTSAARLALRYASDILREDAPGPHLLAGLGAGAALAFEVAAALRRDGAPVALLVAVDGGPGHRGPARARPAVPPPWHPDHARARARRRHWELCVRGWSPHPYDGPLHLLWAAGTPSVGPTQGWGPWVASVEVRRLPVAHERLLAGDGVGPVAAELRGLVDRAWAAAPGPGAGSPPATGPA